jgi:hypothetical protein
MIESRTQRASSGSSFEPLTICSASWGLAAHFTGAVADKELLPLAWTSHIHEGKTYKFAHLEPHTETFVRPATDEQPSESFTVDIRYTDHCFTRGPKPGEVYDPALIYANGEKKIRLFCPRRNELSKLLPGLIRSLPDSKPQHNGVNGNFFTRDLLDLQGNPVKYVIIFSVRKSAKGRMELLVETAYIEEPNYGSSPLNGRRVRFWIILNNTYKRLRIPR